MPTKKLDSNRNGEILWLAGDACDGRLKQESGTGERSLVQLAEDACDGPTQPENLEGNQNCEIALFVSPV